jgi:hypothetical protein
MTLAKYAKTAMASRSESRSTVGSAIDASKPLSCAASPRPAREILLASTWSSFAVFVTYMDVGNADLVWNTDRPRFARAFRSFEAQQDLAVTNLSQMHPYNRAFGFAVVIKLFALNCPCTK